MLSSLFIGPACVRGPTSLYTRTPPLRLSKTCQPLAISTSRSASPVYPVLSVRNACIPCRKWINLWPASSKWSRLPHPLSTHVPKLADFEHSREHLRTMKDPVIRTASPYIDPSVKGPRSKLQAASGPSSLSANSKSSQVPPAPLCVVRPPLLTSSCSSGSVIVNSVNKTGLHPGGVA
jgi:phosphoenolpyruvate carboxykinase (ATP)